MNTEELLKPRYKVIAAYPNSKFYIGTILHLNKFSANKWWHEYTEEEPIHLEEGYEKVFPNILKKLEWWEERDEEDMPEYIECMIDCRIQLGTILKANWKAFTTTKDIAHYNQRPEYWMDARFFKPATQSEYEEYINKK